MYRWRQHFTADKGEEVSTHSAQLTEQEMLLVLQPQTEHGSVLTALREATAEQHRKLEERFDAVSELADMHRRPQVIARYAAFYSSAFAALGPELEPLHELRFKHRRQAWEAVNMLQASADCATGFPAPADLREALGSFYVVEGSILGGRFIQAQLKKQDVEAAELAFLNPYGTAGGSMWRSLLSAIEEHGSGDLGIAAICRGATRAFDHAEFVLCGGTK
ncbi:Heme oxygenase [Nitratireductor basaltis]|uniref:Heme oxygenase n=2 Tax=Nitratireductor basaltis TaxID=472175 RepID=A0A084U8S0_9HYPH|nr:Heme oxygenase [Nitratireductor basaltis]